MRPGSYSGAGFARGDAGLAPASSTTGRRRDGRHTSLPVSAGSTPVVHHMPISRSPILSQANGIDAVLPHFVGYTSNTGAGGMHAHTQGQGHTRSSATQVGISVSASTALEQTLSGSRVRSAHVAAGSTLPVTGSGVLNGTVPEVNAAVEDEVLFTSKKRLPSILLDSWELRKIAPEGSVLPNALVSWDVDGDGVEEILLGTTEGHFFILKPDCRMPIYAYTVSATISVVLYSELMRRLILITLEGQCEVFENFPVPPTAMTTSPGRTRAGGAGAPSPKLTPSNAASGGEFSPSAAAGDEDAAAAAAHTNASAASARAALLRSKRIPQQGSVTSLGTSADGTGSHFESKLSTPSTAFHVASNCLCADISTESDHRDLLFLGSCDNRLYVYTVDDGVCLLSLFMHQPITGLKTFSLPCQVPPPPSVRMTDKSELESVAPDRHAFPPRAPVDVPLIAVTTSTSVVLLPASQVELQRWRRQEKRTGRPLTLADEDTIRHYHSMMQSRKSTSTRPPTTPAATPAASSTAARTDPPGGAGSAGRECHHNDKDSFTPNGTTSAVERSPTNDGVRANTAGLATFGSPTTTESTVTQSRCISATEGTGKPPAPARASATTHTHTHSPAAPSPTDNDATTAAVAAVQEYTRPPMTLLQPLWFARLARHTLIIPPTLSQEEMASGKFSVLNAAKRHRGRGVRPSPISTNTQVPAPLSTTNNNSSNSSSSHIHHETATSEGQSERDDVPPHSQPTASHASMGSVQPIAEVAREALPRRSLVPGEQRTGTAPPQHSSRGAEVVGDVDALSDALAWLPLSVDVSVGGRRALMILSSEDGRACVVSLTPLLENGESALMRHLSPCSRATSTGSAAEGGRVSMGLGASLQRPLVKGYTGGAGRGVPVHVDVTRSQSREKVSGMRRVSSTNCTVVLRSKKSYCPAAAADAASRVVKGTHAHAGPLSFESATSATTSMTIDDTTHISSSDDGSAPTCNADTDPALAGMEGASDERTRVQIYHDIALPLPPVARQAQKQSRPPRSVQTTQDSISSPLPTEDWQGADSPVSPASPSSLGMGTQWPPSSPLAHRRNSSAVSGAPSSPAVSELTLRLQCEWSSFFGPMPLVQRARIFVAEGEDAFTVVLVAANGRCYSFDPDSAAAVECTVRADCSSFTLVAGSSCSVPLTTPTASAASAPPHSPVTTTVSELDGSRTSSGLSPPWASEHPQMPRTNSGLSRRAGGLYLSHKGGGVRPVFCVCVSVDELCLYSVGEAHNTSAIPFAALNARTSALTPVGAKESGGEEAGPVAPAPMKPGGAADIFEAGAVCDGMRHFTDEHDERELLLELGHALLEASGDGAMLVAGDGAGADPADREDAIIWIARQILTQDYSAADWRLLQQLEDSDEL